MANPNPEPGEGSFISHLVELRNRLLYAVVGVLAVFAVLLVGFGANSVYETLAQPLLEAMPAGTSMIATDVASPFLTPIKLTLLASLVVAVPFVLYQVWAFVAPGLYRHERRLVAPLLISSTALFYAGMTFAYYVVFPVVFNFFVGTAPKGVAVMTDIKSYIDFIFTMFFAFGIAFEVPVALVLLVKMGAVDPHKLAAKRPYVLLGVFVIAAILTPPDVLSQTFLALPMYFLFEVGLFVARRMKPKTSEEAPISDAEADAVFDEHERALSDAKGKERE
ncbi:MAG: twin-arginine translocase subunit TatC [Gammaproteobacteria bacterium]